MSTTDALPEPVAQLTKDTSGNLWVWRVEDSPYLDTAVSCDYVYTADQMRAALAAQAEKHAREVRGTGVLLDSMQAQRDALRAERDALKADAERYRWLRTEIYDDSIPRVQSISVGCIGCALEGPELDAVIDAARTGGQP